MSLKSLTEQHTVTHKRRSVTSGSWAGQVNSPTTISTTLKCRIQEISAAQRVELGRDGFEVSHVVYFNSDPGVQVNDWFEHEGSVLEVVYVRNFDRLGRLWRVDCNERTDKDPR